MFLAPRTLLGLCLTSISALPAQTSPSGTRRALLIGIDTYAHVPLLRGCVHDTRLVAHLLRARYGFTDIRLLHNEQATRTGMLHALRQIIEDADSRDVVHIHYSGHGAQVFDLDEDEDDGRDETLVPQNGRDPDNKIADILDDELAAILGRRKTQSITVVLDACHSGSGVRNVRSRILTRGLPADDDRLDLYRDLATVQSRDIIESDLPFPVITSARADQKALDGPVDGTYHGLYTAAWVRAMASATVEDCVLDVHRAAGAEYASIVERLRVRHLASTPVLESRPSRRDEPFFPKFDGRIVARRPSVAVRPSSRANVVLLVGGANAGSGIGSFWAVFRKGETEFRAGSAIATGVLLEFRGADAALRIDRYARAAADGSQWQDCRAIPIASAPAGPEIHVRVAGGSTANREQFANSLRTLIPEVRWIRGRDAGTPSDFTIQLRRGEHRVFGDDGETELASVPSQSGMRSTAAVLARSLARTDLMALENRATEMGLRIWHDRNGGIEHPPGDQQRSRSIKVLATGARHTKYVVHHEGDPLHDKNCFLLNLEADRDCYVTVVNLDDAGEMTLLFPNKHSTAAGYLPDGLIRAGQATRIPDQIASRNRAGFVLAYHKPGREVVRAFATDDLETASRIRTAFAEIEQRNSGLDPQSLNAVNNQREVLENLRDYLLRTATRDIAIKGIEVVSNQPRTQASNASANPEPDSDESWPETDASPVGDWTVATIRVEVRR